MDLLRLPSSLTVSFEYSQHTHAHACTHAHAHTHTWYGLFSLFLTMRRYSLYCSALLLSVARSRKISYTLLACIFEGDRTRFACTTTYILDNHKPGKHTFAHTHTHTHTHHTHTHTTHTTHTHTTYIPLSASV